MRKKDFIKIINEEISEFDFLNNEQYLSEQEDVKLLHEEAFQRQFIIDSITRMNEKIEQNNVDVGISYIDPELDDNPHDDLTIEYSVDISYKFNDLNDPIKFNLFFGGHQKIGYSTSGYYDPGNYDNAPEGEHNISTLDWWSIPVTLYTLEGDEVEFTALEKEPENVQELFVRTYLEDAIENKTEFSIEEKRPVYNSPPIY